MVDAVWVGVDLGTQSVRAVAVDAAGTLLSAAARPLTSRRDGNRHEQDAGEWWAKVLPHARLEVLPDVGHLLVVPFWARALGHLAVRAA